jgi:formylglycine-generating enzyme required for sulfatase activity
MLLAGAAFLLAAASVGFTVAVALSHRTGPARCPPGLLAEGARCCGEGQTSEGGRCVGRPQRCAETQTLTPGGCVAPAHRISYAAAKSTLGTDWDGAGRNRSSVVAVTAFELDSTEVTVARWRSCSAATQCEPLPATSEPGEPVRGVTPEQAEAFCRFAGGRLPSGAEWGVAAMGSDARRFPWGGTGLVCRRAAYGLAAGPCADGATGPELAGSRPDGATPDGALDLAGNVAEWTREARGYVARGGSFRSTSAAELKSFAAEAAGVRLDIGFRCAYPKAR